MVSPKSSPKPTPELTSFSLTHVYYNSADPTQLSLLSACLALAPQALVLSYVIIIYTSREAEVVLMGIGQTLSEVINFFVKRHLREERPPGMLGKGYGMPSSHAQFAFFFSTYAALFLLFRHKPTTHTASPSSEFERRVISILAIICATAVAASRVYLGYHTIKQVAVGGAMGVGLAIVWFIIIGYLRSSGIVGQLLNNTWARMFRFRDLLIEEDFADAGWARWEARRKRD